MLQIEELGHHFINVGKAFICWTFVVIETEKEGELKSQVIG